MAPSFKTRLRPSPARAAPLGHMASVLRLAARERQSSAAAPAWLGGLTRALRAAGPGQGDRPLHGVLAGAEFAPSQWLGAR